ncbi:MAG: ArnT family glycosyltransferase [Flavobacteriales bacterium]
MKFINHPLTIKIFLFLLFIVYCLSFFIDVIDVDSAQYAAISMEMLQTNSLLEIKERGMDYLDKPPLLFWISSLSYHFFGINNFAYKLPSLLISLLGIFSTYKLANLLHGKKIAINSIIILCTTIGYVWINSDIKTDLILTSFIIFTFWQLIEFLKKGKLIHVLGIGAGISFAMMSKGPIGFIVPLIAFFLLIYFRETRKHILSFKLLWVFPIIILLLAPMFYGLYIQFDIPGDKIIKGQVIDSGLKFFFWTQSFGRITHENVFDNNTSFFYLWHTSLLLAIPWSLLIIYSVKNKFTSFWKTKKLDFNNHILLIISLTVISLLSFSSYKIPHYAMVIFPFISIILSKEISNLKERIIKINYQIFISLSFLMVTVLLLGFCMKIWDIALIGLFYSILFLPQLKENYFFKTVLCGITIGFMFNSFLLKTEEYSLPIQLKTEINRLNIHKDDLYFLSTESSALEFMINKRIESTSIQSIERGKWYVINPDKVWEVENEGYKISEKVKLEYYDLNRISLAFINPFQKKEFRERLLIKVI